MKLSDDVVRSTSGTANHINGGQDARYVVDDPWDNSGQADGAEIGSLQVPQAIERCISDIVDNRCCNSDHVIDYSAEQVSWAGVDCCGARPYIPPDLVSKATSTLR